VGLDYQTLRNYAWIARKFEASRRRSGLPFQHHAEVAALPPAEQDEWLDRAQREGWSRTALRRALRASRDPGSQPVRAVLPRVVAGGEAVDRWRRAAMAVDADFEAWIVAALDRAADHALELVSVPPPAVSAPEEPADRERGFADRPAVRPAS
jgi:hypothetical protein